MQDILQDINLNWECRNTFPFLFTFKTYVMVVYVIINGIMTTKDWVLNPNS